MRLSVLLAALAAMLLPLVLAGQSSHEAKTLRASMREGTLLIASTRDQRRLPVLIARTSAQRATGYQHLPRADARPMWFVFQPPGISSWHMRNVDYPLDIAFVDAGGWVIDIQRMLPEHTGYRPPAPIAAALEVPAGQLAALAIQVGTRLHLTQGDAR